MENILANLKYSCIKFKFYTEQPIIMDFWIGAVIRNRFLFAAESIRDERGRSLREIIDTLPLAESHFMYKYWKGGFPKGFLIDCSMLPYKKPGFTLEKDHIYTLSLYLTGFMSAYSAMYIEALKKMFTDGFGYPETPLKVCEVVDEGEFGIPDFSIETAYKWVELHFLTPVSLMHVDELGENGYQKKMNAIPSFYQFMRSVAYRMISLNILYAADTTFESRDEIDRYVEGYVSDAMDAVLLRADIHYARRYSTPRKDCDSVYAFEGYTGQMNYKKVPSRYLPVLLFASALGIGSDTTYSMGIYTIKFNAKYNL